MIEVFNVRVLVIKTLVIFKLIDPRGARVACGEPCLLTFHFFFLIIKIETLEMKFSFLTQIIVYLEKNRFSQKHRGIQQKQDFYSGHV